MFIDSHCHPQFPQYDQDREEMIKRTIDDGVKMIAVGTDFEMSAKAVELAKRYEGIWAAVGLHPNDNLPSRCRRCLSLWEQVPERIGLTECQHQHGDGLDLYKKLASDPKVVAIGEIGLDYYRTTGEELIAKQKDRFIKFLELARETNKPLILHCRDAYTDMLEMLDAAATLFSGSAVRGVVHSFTSSWETAEKFLERGFLIGLNGIITFTEQYDEVVKNIPLDKLLLETDAPYLSPAPYRGKRNESIYLNFIAEKIAKIKGETVEKIAEQTSKNTERLFIKATP